MTFSKKSFFNIETLLTNSSSKTECAFSISSSLVLINQQDISTNLSFPDIISKLLWGKKQEISLNSLLKRLGGFSNVIRISSASIVPLYSFVLISFRKYYDKV